MRGWLARRSLSRCRGACNAIQAHWRGHVARRRVARIRAAVVIQKHVRGHECRRALAAQQKAATQIQVLLPCILQTVWVSHLQAPAGNPQNKVNVILHLPTRHGHCRRL